VVISNGDGRGPVNCRAIFYKALYRGI